MLHCGLGVGHSLKAKMNLKTDDFSGFKNDFCKNEPDDFDKMPLSAVSEILFENSMFSDDLESIVEKTVDETIDDLENDDSASSDQLEQLFGTDTDEEIINKIISVNGNNNSKDGVVDNDDDEDDEDEDDEDEDDEENIEDNDDEDVDGFDVKGSQSNKIYSESDDETNNDALPLRQRRKRRVRTYSSSSSDDDDETAKIKNSEYKLFYKPRAAAVKATAAISTYTQKKRQKKTGSNKDDDEDEKKRKTCDDSYEMLKKEYGIVLPKIVWQNIIEDTHLEEEEHYIPNAPTKPSTYDILCEYARKKNADLDALNLILDAFDRALPYWLLRRIEKLHFNEVYKKNPDRPMSHLYGLPHLVRFLTCLPQFFTKLRKQCEDDHAGSTSNYANFQKSYNESMKIMSDFIKGFLAYMVEEQLRINVNKDYINVIPEYYRMTYQPIRINNSPDN